MIICVTGSSGQEVLRNVYHETADSIGQNLSTESPGPSQPVLLSVRTMSDEAIMSSSTDECQKSTEPPASKDGRNDMNLTVPEERSKSLMKDDIYFQTHCTQANILKDRTNIPSGLSSTFPVDMEVKYADTILTVDRENVVDNCGFPDTNENEIPAPMTTQSMKANQNIKYEYMQVESVNDSSDIKPISGECADTSGHLENINMTENELPGVEVPSTDLQLNETREIIEPRVGVDRRRHYNARDLPQTTPVYPRPINCTYVLTRKQFNKEVIQTQGLSVVSPDEFLASMAKRPCLKPRLKTGRNLNLVKLVQDLKMRPVVVLKRLQSQKYTSRS